MVLPLASRFSVLTVEDDEDNVKKISNKNQNKKKPDGKNTGSFNQKQDPKKKKTNQVKNQQQANQNSGKAKNKPQGGVGGNNHGGGGGKRKGNADQQWEMWKQKDAQLVDGNYESELHQAILLSQLDYEEKKDIYAAAEKEQELEKKAATAAKKKNKNKAQTMSLSEFNSLPDPSMVKQSNGGGGDADDVDVNGQTESDPEFFDRIKQDAKKAFHTEQAAEKRKAREPFVNDAITIAQFEDQLERRDKEIEELKKEVTRLKEELHNVKTRNKNLCQILGQGEMRDKAEVLVQMKKTQKVKDELSNEVERLHGLLEQERSKVRSLTSANDKGKGKGKKRTASENT